MRKRDMIVKTETKGAAYIRVSHRDQVNEGLSLTVQRNQIEAYCKLKGIELIEIIEDAGISARNLKRPGMQHLLSMVKDGEVQSVIILKLDRMFRSVRDAISTMELFENKNIDFHCIQDSIDTSTALGKFFFQVMAAIAELERNTTGERIKTVFADKKAQGKKIAGHTPLGFDADENGFLIQNAREADTLTRMMQMHSEGWTLKSIAQSLNFEGHTTKLGKAWNEVQVHRYIQREVQL